MTDTVLDKLDVFRHSEPEIWLSSRHRMEMKVLDFVTARVGYREGSAASMSKPPVNRSLLLSLGEGTEFSSSLVLDEIFSP